MLHVRDPLGSLVEAIGALVDALERSGFPYALGGAVAYSAWAEPRATRDVDVNLWVSPDRLDEGFAVFESAGVLLDRAQARGEARERGMFVGRLGEYRVDVFVPSVPFYDEALQRRVRSRIAGRDTWVLSAETLAVFKMLFYRPKDLADVGRLLDIQRERFDTAFVRRWLVDMLGAADERIETWDEIVASKR
jgi:hypothetical protein